MVHDGTIHIHGRREVDRWAGRQGVTRIWSRGGQEMVGKQEGGGVTRIWSRVGQGMTGWAGEDRKVKE
jgi:hypothetical protein